ncbi:MAG TPA: extracellular solute-binding protein [Candidatus Enterococcus avicola]|uniref:Extracellular solute-binding protein n=1 Tax=Candidatus Enterococcus avicola TaxID=2838561 RepID=A0A9D2JIB9_9ENTE|nr:extracellular solute-binding protein [Candidatus Enterococcus avicola]
MARWKKRLFGSLLFSIPFVLAACGGSEESTVNADGNTVITIGRQTAPNPKLPEGDSYSDNAYTRLIKEELNIELTSAFEAGGDDYNRQVSLAIASGELPDTMLVGSRDELEELVDNDLIADLSEVFEEKGSQELKDIYASFDNLQLEAATFDDKLMALPSTSDDFGPNMIWIRKDWLDELNIELDKDGNNAITLEELKTTAKAFQENDLDGTGKAVGTALSFWLSSGGHGGTAYTGTAIMNAFGAYPKTYLQDADGKMYYGSNTEAMRESLEYIKEWYDEGLLDKQFGTRTYDDIHAMMLNGEFGIIPGPWHMPDWGLIQAKQSNPKADFVPYAIENVNKDGKINAVSNRGTGQFIVVRKDFKDIDKVMEMINLIYADVMNSDDMEKEYPEIYEYSKLDVDGTVKPYNVVFLNAYSEIDDAVLASKAATGEIPMEDISSFFIKDNANKIKSYMDNPEQADSVNWTRYASRYLAVDQVMGSVRESEILHEEFPPRFNRIEANERNGAQVGKLEEEMFIKFITGEESLENFDNYVATWNKQGGEAILSEMQSIVDDKK